MTITITDAEAKAIVEAHFTSRLGAGIVVNIVNGWDSIYNQIVEAVETVSAYEKIARIKALRSVVENAPELNGAKIGLADGKYAIENWESFKHFLRTHGRLPHQSAWWNTNGFV